MWLVFSLISVIFLAGRNITSKLNVDKTNELVVMWFTLFFALPIAAIAMAFNKFEIKESSFWILTGIRVILDLTAFVFFFKALKFKSASFVIPLLSLLPVFTIVTSYFINGQSVNLVGILGIFIISIFAILLYFSEQKLTKKEDIKDLRKAALLILGTTLIYSVLDPLHAEVIKKSNPYTYFFISEMLFVLVFTPIMLFLARKPFFQTIKNRKSSLLNASVGIFLGIEVLCLFVALQESPFVSYVAAIRTGNIALTSILAVIFLKEKLNNAKVISITFIVLGALILVLS